MDNYGIIYKITNLKNKKVYIGQTNSNFNRRYDHGGIGIERVYRHHNYLKKTGRSYNSYLLRSIIKYGFDSFEVIEIFDSAKTKEELDLKEKYWIKKYKSNYRKYGYNIHEGGNACKHTEETIEKIRAKKLKMSEETKRKISLSHLGKPGLKGEKNPMFGKIPWNKGVKREDVKGHKNGRAIKIICLNTLEIFECAKYAADKYNLKAHQMIGASCRGKQISCGKDEKGNRLYWAFLNDYEQIKHLNYDEIQRFKENKYIKHVNTEVTL